MFIPKSQSIVGNSFSSVKCIKKCHNKRLRYHLRYHIECQVRNSNLYLFCGSTRIRIKEFRIRNVPCLLQGSRKSGNVVLSFKIFPVLRIHDVYSGFRILIFSVPDPGSNINKNSNRTGEEKYVFLLFCSHKFHKIGNFLFLNRFRNKLSQFTKPKMVTKLSEHWLGIQNPGSGKKTYSRSGSRCQKASDPGFGSATL